MAEEEFSMFQIYSLEKLFFELKNACSRLGDGCEFPQMSLAKIELERDAFNYTSHIACNFHVEEDTVQHCSKSFVQRWVYLICDHCCKDVGVDVVPGQHVPKNADVGFKTYIKVSEPPKEPKKFTWVDHSKTAKSSYFDSLEHEPPPRRAKPNLAAMRERSQVDQLELDFPMMSLGHGRVGGDRAPRGRGYTPPMSFAAAMKK